jgi:hypothetical protein
MDEERENFLIGCYFDEINKDLLKVEKKRMKKAQKDIRNFD